MPSALRDVRSALYTLYDAALADPVIVFNGPRPRSATPKQYLLVGVNGIDELEAGMRSNQVPSPLSGDWRDETGEVDCTAVAWTGEVDMTTIRSVVEGMVDTCESALNADRRLGGLLIPANNVAHVTRLDVREQHTDNGPFVEAVLTVSYTTTLTT